MADEPIVIVDGSGVEHEFPAGFDVQRAIEIVKNSGPQKLDTTPGAADTPMSRARVIRPNSDLSQMAASQTADAALAGGTGFVKGYGHRVVHPLETVGGLVSGAVGAGRDAVVGLAHLATDPQKTLSNVGPDIRDSVMNRIPTAISGEVSKAATDPESFGRDVGGATADAQAGLAIGKAVPFLPKPIAQRAGELMETTGQHMKWPIRMVGAHQLGSGNPMGILTMALPEQLKSSGQKLQRWGIEPGALAGTPEETFLQVQQDLHKASSDPAIASQLSAQLDDLRTKLVTQRQEAKLPADLAIVQKAQNRVDQLSKALQSTVGKASKTVDPTALTETELAQIRRQVTDPELQAQVIERFKAQKAGTAPAAPVAAPVVRPPIRVTGPMQLPTEAPVAPAVAPTPAPPIRAVGDKVLTNSPDLATKSRLGEMSATPGFTVNDLESVGLNPRLNYKSLTREVLDQLKSNRADRSDTYRINAGLDKGGSDALLRD